MAPTRSSSALAGTAVLACAGSTAFVSAPRSAAAPAVRAPVSGVAPVAAAVPTNVGVAGAIMGGAMGLAGTVAVAAGAARRSRVAARVGKNQPSLIQVLEQKKLLSTVEGLGLLSTAERLGVSADLPEKFGLLKFAEKKGILSYAEAVLTSPNTPIVLLLAAGALVCGVYLDLTESATLGFGQWVLAGAFGVPAIVCLVAAVAIFALFGGVSRTKNLDLVEEVDTYSTGGSYVGTFGTKKTSRSVTLLNVLEEKGLLSFAEENGLLSLATSIVGKPLTLTEQAKVLSTLESTGLLSTVESSASDQFGAANYGLTGLAIITAAIVSALLVPDYGALLAVLLALPGLGFLGVGLGFSIVQAPRKA